MDWLQNNTSSTMEVTPTSKCTNIYHANYLESAIHHLKQCYRKLPNDNKFKLTNNLWVSELNYRDLHILIQEELQRALKAYDADPVLIDENYKTIQELYDLFENLTCCLP